MRLLTKILLVILLTVLFALTFWYFNLKVFLADHYLKEAISYRIGKLWPAVLDNYAKVFYYQPGEPYYQRYFAQELMWGLDYYKTNETKIKILDFAIERMQEIPAQNQVFEMKTYLARLYGIKANLTQDASDFLSAEQTIAEAAAISPKMAAVYNDWCQIKIYQKKWQEAEEMCKKSFYLEPDLDYPQIAEIHRNMVKSEMSGLYEKFGQIYFEEKNYKKAEEMYLQALKFFPLEKYYLWKKIADIYYAQGDLDTAIQKNLHGYTLNPKDPNWPLAIGLLYQEKGDLELAKFYGQKALELAPEDQRILNFLESIDRER